MNPRARRRTIPNTISKRFRRKLRRSPNPFLLWLCCKRPTIFARLTRLRSFQFINTLCKISPFDTPFFSASPKVKLPHVVHEWWLDA